VNKQLDAAFAPLDAVYGDRQLGFELVVGEGFDSWRFAG
jgi:hypothetical protein